MMKSNLYKIYKNEKMEKKGFTDEELSLMAERFKMLSEVSRLKILRTLFDGEKCVTQIVEISGLLQANVSKQLRLLENHGIVECRPQGLQRFYKLIDFTIHQICNAVCLIDKKP